LVVFGRIDFGGLGEERGVDRQRYNFSCGRVMEKEGILDEH
jgi:hypothetical protein